MTVRFRSFAENLNVVELSSAFRTFRNVRDVTDVDTTILLAVSRSFLCFSIRYQFN
jgi:hypothetical protein